MAYFHGSHAAYLKQYPGFAKFALTLNNISRTHIEKLQFDSAAYWATQAIAFAGTAKAVTADRQRWLMYGWAGWQGGPMVGSWGDACLAHPLRRLQLRALLPILCEHIHRIAPPPDLPLAPDLPAA